MGAERGKRRRGGGGEFRLKEIFFYSLFLFFFDIIEILIMKIKYFSKIYKLYTKNGTGGWKRSLIRTGREGWNRWNAKNGTERPFFYSEQNGTIQKKGTRPERFS